MPDTTPGRPAMTMREIRDRLGHARPDTTPTTDPARCPGCGHAHHGADVECEASVEHGPKHWHRCLCLARPYASSACPPPMHCQGGSLGYTDIYYLQRGHTVGGPNGRKITPDVLKLAPWIEGDPLMEAIAAAVYEQAETTEGGLVVEDPRNIAAAAATVARLVLGTTDQQPEASPCGPAPDVCDAEAGDPCANHEREQAHSEGEHAFCGNECAVATDQQPETAPAGTGLRDVAAQAIRDSNGSPEALAWWQQHPQLVPAHVYADAVLAVLPATTDRAVADQPADRRARYAAAITGALPLANRAIDAVMAVADTERENDRLTLENNSRYIKRLDTEYDGLRAELESHRIALSDAVGLGTGAPWDAIRDRAAELHRLAAEVRAATYRAAANYVRGQSADERYGKASISTALCMVSDALHRMADEAQQPEAHSCLSCEGVDPDTCWANPNRPPEQCPVAEFEDYGRQCQKPVGHELHTFEEQPADEAQQPETEAACGHCGGGGHAWDDCEAYTALVRETEPSPGVAADEQPETEAASPQPPRILAKLCEQHRPVLEPAPTARVDGQYLVSCKACDGGHQQIVRTGDPIPECRFWIMGKAYGYVTDTPAPTEERPETGLPAEQPCTDPRHTGAIREQLGCNGPDPATQAAADRQPETEAGK